MRVCLLMTVLAGLLWSCSSKKTETSNAKDSTSVSSISRIVGVASIEPKGRIVSLYSEVSGIVKKINHDINDTVKAGEVIIELTGNIESTQLQQSQSKISTQKAAIQSAEDQLASVKVKMESSLTNYNRNKKLIETGAITKQQLDDSRFDYEAKEKDVQTSQSNLLQQKDRLKEMFADVKYSEEVVKRKSIVAPSDGKVLSIDVKVGNNISPSQTIGDFAPKGPLIAVTEVDELFADKVNEGMKAYIRPQGRLDTLATGTVFLTSPYLRKKSLFADAATNMEDRRVREVRVLLDPGSRVLIGSRVECVIILK
jgi:HlyD family secretion protein